MVESSGWFQRICKLVCIESYQRYHVRDDLGFCIPSLTFQCLVAEINLSIKFPIDQIQPTNKGYQSVLILILK